MPYFVLESGGTKQKEPHSASGPEVKLPHSCHSSDTSSSDTCPSADTLQRARENKGPISTHLPEILLQVSCAIVLPLHSPWLSSTLCPSVNLGGDMAVREASLPSSALPLPSTRLTAPAERAATRLVTNLPCYSLSFIYTGRTVAIQSEKAPCFQRRTARRN